MKIKKGAEFRFSTFYLPIRLLLSYSVNISLVIGDNVSLRYTALFELPSLSLREGFLSKEFYRTLID